MSRGNILYKFITVLLSTLAGCLGSRQPPIDPKIIPDLISTLSSSQDANERIEASKLLRFVNEPGAVGTEVSKPLVSALKDPNCAVRMNAAYGLEKWLPYQWNDNAQEALLSSLNDKMPYVREAAIKALGAITPDRINKDTVQRLQEIVSKDEAAEVRRSAKNTLKKFSVNKPSPY